MASKFFDHGKLERNVSLLGIAALIVVWRRPKTGSVALLFGGSLAGLALNLL